jgi:hypothetical protein
MNARHATNTARKFLQMQGFLQTPRYVYLERENQG